MLEAIADLAVVACHNAEAYDDVRTAASTDALTGLLNHGAMQVRVREEIARAARDGQPLCCVLIDLDDFKRVNDELGHPAGDALLRRVADALRAEVRALRPGRPLRRRRVRARAPRHRGARGPRGRRARARARPRRRAARRRTGRSASCSIGVSAWEAPMGADDLLAAADRALLLAKRTGKGRVAVANPDAEEELARLQDADGSPAAVQALAAAIDARDNRTAGHSEQVVRPRHRRRAAARPDRPTRSSASATARCCTTSASSAIPPEILQKDGVLDDAEWDVMAEHPVIGEGILRRLPQLAPLAPIVRHEHEHWDGSGLPGRPRRHADPDRLAHHPRLRRLRRDDRRAALPRRARAGGRGRRAARPRGHAVRPAGGRGAARPARLPR